MTTFYSVSAALGGAVLLLQIVLSLVGMVDHEVHDAATMEEGLDLLSVRALSAGLAFFGLGGLAGLWVGLGPVFSFPLAALTGAAALLGTAWLTRSMLRLESDRTHLVEEAIGEIGTVYLSIPAARESPGKVHVTIRERLLELPAVTSGGAIPTGATVRVVDTLGETLVVEPNSLPE